MTIRICKAIIVHPSVIGTIPVTTSSILEGQLNDTINIGTAINLDGDQHLRRSRNSDRSVRKSTEKRMGDQHGKDAPFIQHKTKCLVNKILFVKEKTRAVQNDRVRLISSIGRLTNMD